MHCIKKELLKGDSPNSKDVAPESEKGDLKSFACGACRGDLYVIGAAWISTLQTALVGARWGLVPTTHAAPPPPPQKPPEMKFKDLPIYSCPHLDYKNYVSDQRDTCPGMKKKMIHEAVQPYVTSFREGLTQIASEVSTELGIFKRDISAACARKKQELLDYVRCPSNLAMRRATVAIGGLAGFMYARKRGLIAKFAYTSVGLLVTGALCFPEETDEHFRTACYHAGTAAATFYNFFCSKNFGLQKKLPCPADMVELPPDRPKTECTKKREEAERKAEAERVARERAKK